MKRVRGFFRKLRRAWDYACFGWSNGDYDWAYLLALLHFKLARMEKALTGQHAYSQQEPKTIRSLRIARKLADRLAKDQIYDEPLHRFVARERSGGRVPKDLYRAAARAAATHRDRDLRWLTSIINKYLQRWWD